MDPQLHKQNLRKRLAGEDVAAGSLVTFHRLLATSPLAGMSPVVRPETLPVLPQDLLDDVLERLRIDGFDDHVRRMWAEASAYREDIFGFVVDYGRGREYLVALVVQPHGLEELVIVTADDEGIVPPAGVPAVGWIIW